jgi:hypothetical protein
MAYSLHRVLVALSLARSMTAKSVDEQTTRCATLYAEQTLNANLVLLLHNTDTASF